MFFDDKKHCFRNNSNPRNLVKLHGSFTKIFYATSLLFYIFSKICLHALTRHVKSSVVSTRELFDVFPRKVKLLISTPKLKKLPFRTFFDTEELQNIQINNYNKYKENFNVFHFLFSAQIFVLSNFVLQFLPVMSLQNFIFHTTFPSEMGWVLKIWISFNLILLER